MPFEMPVNRVGELRMLHVNIEPPAMVGLPLPSADASGDELFRMGLLYSTGQGGAPLDYVSAHMLFNLAAMRGSIEAKIYRKELSQEMASGDVAEAQRAAREWLSHG
jgi:TPR repeat protein